ncbi:hypothetical protein J6590_025697 [Homalodisca vitripennis]|nr:hypothetical protein J6590_025697 [Homalodisca vitripennis]
MGWGVVNKQEPLATCRPSRNSPPPTPSQQPAPVANGYFIPLPFQGYKIRMNNCFTDLSLSRLSRGLQDGIG